MRTIDQLFSRTAKTISQFGPMRSLRADRNRCEKLRRRRLMVERLECRALLTAGMLDPTFGSGGKVITNFLLPQTVGTTATAVEVASNGKIVVAGYGADMAYYIARYNTDGSLDSTFGNGGRQSSSFDGAAEDLAIGSDGSVVVVGYASTLGNDGNSTNQMAVARLTPNGQPDNAFGVGGKQTVNFGSSNDLANSVALQPDGKIVVVGSTTSSDVGGTHFAVARLTANGQLDTSFDGDGKQTISFGSSNAESAQAVAIQSSGKILISGTSDQSATTGYDVAVTRLTTSGQVDTTFGNTGKTTFILNEGVSIDENSRLALQADDAIVLGGNNLGIGNGFDFSVGRLTADGVLDVAFGNNGRQFVDFGSDDRALAVAVQGGGSIVVGSDGSIIVVGNTRGLDEFVDFAAYRLTANGLLDTSFGNQGMWTHDVKDDFPGPYSGPGVLDEAQRVTILPDAGRRTDPILLVAKRLPTATTKNSLM